MTEPAERPDGGAASSAAGSPAAPADVPDDLPCIRCGYALTGLPVDGDCPECGTSIRRSLDGDRIARADPRWLDRVELGLRLLRLGLTVGVAGLAAFIVILLASFGVELVVTLPPLVEAATEIVLQALSYGPWVGAALAAAGGWLATTREPRDTDREHRRDPRPTARWGPLIAIALASAAIVVRLSLASPHGRVVALALLVGAAAAAGLGLSALCARFRQLAVRLPAGPLAARCGEQATWLRRTGRTVAIAVAVRFAVSLAPASIAGPAATTAPPTGAGLVVELVDSVAMLAILIAALSTLVRTPRLAALARDLRKSIRSARAAAPPPPSPDAGPT